MTFVEERDDCKLYSETRLFVHNGATVVVVNTRKIFLIAKKLFIAVISLVKTIVFLRER
jgi:Tfp pilus assembly protein PilZ